MEYLNNMILRNEYFPEHGQNLMKGEGDLEAARQHYFSRRPSNLSFLLEKRFGWMAQYIPKGAKAIYELGSGAGFSKEFIKHSELRLTDISGKPWVDQYVDALNLPFPDNSVDVFICSHMIHHLANPYCFLQSAIKKLKPGGVIIISEIETSLLMRLVLRVMRHEGWSYDVDVFDSNTVANDPRDPWSANCAIPELLFKDIARFERNFSQTKVVLNELTECFIFLLSGGVIAKSPTINLPKGILKVVHLIDSILVRFFPSIFAMGRRVVLQKK